MKKEIEIQRIRKRYLKEIVCQSRKWLVMAGIAMLILSIFKIPVVDAKTSKNVSTTGFLSNKMQSKKN